ncbi:MAG: discoidin domain-containing protein [Planctomycetes bacterium]|nr:discoidin domain-containing protein [Planctomycetota bacterium]
MPNNKRVWIVSSVFLGALVLPVIAGAAAPKPDYLWWKFDDGSGAVAKDSSGNGRDGAITGATWQVPGAGDKGSCLNFNSNGTVINAAAGTGLNGKSEITFALWIKSRVTNSDKGFIICENPASNDSFCTMRYDASGANGGGANVLKMAVTSTSGEQQLESSAGRQTTEWQHVAMTWKSGVGLKFYSNGKLDTPSNVQAANTGAVSGNTTLIVGQGGKDAGSGWNGLIDDVRIYTTALTDAQVADLLSFTSADAASGPSPADKATDVPRDSALRWTAAVSAQKHNVYLGTEFTDVNTADLTKAVSTGQTATTYQPAGALAYGQTYYWRVDEVNAATVTKGDVWSFTAEPYAYPIKNVTATASDSQPGAGPENTVNGSGLNSLDQHSTELNNMWLSGATKPTWIQFAFDKAYQLSEMRVWNSNQIIESVVGFGLKSVKVEYSVDGATWTELSGVPEFAQASGLPTYVANTTVNFGGVVAKYVKLTVISAWGIAPQVGLSEVRFLAIPVQARAPQPAAAATGVAVDASLTWRPGRGAASHTVYFGADVNAVTNGTVAAKSATEDSFSPGTLNLGTTYYWRVDEVNAVTYPGDVWSFTTEAYRTVEDFESYTDVEGNRIYEVWVDGFDNPAQNGAVVGLATAANGTFGDTTIFHGGRQSMPLAYDNTAAPLSEAVLTLAPAQDWTASGIKSLVLYFQGATGNGGQLYVKINNTKVPYNGNAGDLAQTTWQRWDIDLSAVAGGVNQVTKLTIGVEGAGAKGTLHIDDVRLSPTLLTPITQPIITKVVRANGQAGSRTDASPIKAFTGSTTPASMPTYGLMDDAMVFSDRAYPWSKTPAELVGAEYVLTFNTDKNAGETDVTYTVTLSRAATIYLTCDDRITDQQAAVDRVVAAFAKPGQFQNTGLKLYVHENATTDRPMSVFAADLPAGTYVFGAQDSGNNFYTIIVKGK